MFYALTLLCEYIDAFKAVTRHTDLGDKRHVIEILDVDRLATLLSQLEQRLQGSDAFNSIDFKLKAQKANLSFSDLVLLGLSKQQKKIELGDLGEVLSCLALLAHFGHDPKTLFPKNVGKLNARVSVPGIDIIVAYVAESVADDLMIFVECKATGLKDKDFGALFSAANTSNKTITIDRVFDELRQISFEARYRDTRPELPERLLNMMFAYVNDTVEHEAHLHADDTPDHRIGAESSSRLSTVVMFKADMDTLRHKTFAYRHNL